MHFHELNLGYNDYDCLLFDKIVSISGIRPYPNMKGDLHFKTFLIKDNKCEKSSVRIKGKYRLTGLGIIELLRCPRFTYMFLKLPC